jgi:diguanylate cyclase (GGDEF)-like protein
MKSLGYEKVVKMSLIGFVILAIIVLIMFNVYMNKEKEFAMQDVDINLSQSILNNNNNIAMKINEIYNQTYLKANWLENIFNNQLDMNGDILDYIKYNESNDISYIDRNALNTNQTFGNIIIQGDINDKDEKIKYQINDMNNFFTMENILTELNIFEVSSIYYSQNGYVAYYPYDEGNVEALDYEVFFANVHNMITQLETLDSEDLNSAIKNGWQKTTLINEEDKLTYSVAMPVIVEDNIDGILVCSISEKTIENLIIDRLTNVDMYLVNQNDEVLYANVEGVSLKENLSDVFIEQYNNEIKYYENKFPQTLEKRVSDDYTLYISLFEKNDWYLIYVYKNSQISNELGRIAINILIILLVVGVVYYGVKNSNRRRNDLELKARNAKYDSMTNMLNHKHIIDVLDDYYKNKRVKQMGIMMMDIDDFKKVNDNYGHAVGDEVIHICADVIKEVLEKRIGVGGRYGGEEFLIAMPRAEKEIVYEMAEEIRTSISERIREKLEMSVTVSGGLYYITKPVEMTILELINVADANLYVAKRLGKNRIVKTAFEPEREMEEKEEPKE